jgi:hypothetical protein
MDREVLVGVALVGVWLVIMIKILSVMWQGA